MARFSVKRFSLAVVLVLIVSLMLISVSGCASKSPEVATPSEVPSVAKIDELKAILKAKKEQNPQIQTVISADKNVSHGHVVKVIDLVRKLGISKFAVSVELSEE